MEIIVGTRLTMNVVATIPGLDVGSEFLPDPWGNIKDNTARFDDPFYNWGYVGAGPLNLARAILNRFIGGKIAFKYCHRFAREVVSKFDDDHFRITNIRVKRWVNRQVKLDRLARRRELYHKALDA